MLIDKWRPLFAPETEVGTGEAEGKAPPAGAGDQEGREDNRRLGGRSELRKQLEKNFEADRKTTPRADGRTAEGRFARGGEAAREREEEQPEEQEVEGQEAAEGEQAEGEEQQTEEQQEAARTAGTPPEGWAKDAKAEWLKLPAAVQTAVKKRETDMAKGVEDLKARYADIDRTLQPHMESIRRHGHTPAQAVGQLFAWFSALTANPQVAFPALAKSFGHDIRQFVEQPGKPGDQSGTGQEGQEAKQPVPPELQQWFQKQLEGLKGELGQKFGLLENSLAVSSQQKAEETLAVWSKDKPYFERVRTIMAELIGKGVVPLREGRVDLDAAYDKALFYDPEIRNEVLAAQDKAKDDERKRRADAERKAAQDRADKARRANVGLAPSAPGSMTGDQQRQGKKGKTVRDSLKEAIEAHRE